MSPSSLTPCQPFKLSTQLIQTRWSRACTPPLQSQQLSFQYPSSGCLLMWDWQETKQQTDLQKSAVRLRRHRSESPTERPRYFSALSTMETGRKKTVDTRYTLTQFGDWSGPSRALSSTCAQGTVVWVPIWRWLAFQTLPCVSADKLTKPQTTSFTRPHPSVLPKIYRETSANMTTRRWSGDQAVGLGRRPLPDG